jgi:peptide methionine sulfoxide reductase msrA/msrB
MSSNRILQSLLLILSLSFLLTACAKEKSVAETRKTLPPAANAQLDSIVLGMGCFWGAEKRMAEIPGVVDVESGYANGDIPGTYEAVLDHERAVRRGRSDKRNHAEVVKVTYDPAQTTLETVLIKFWESHDPTQGDRQGNDVGSNYRSAVYTHSPAQLEVANKTRAAYQQALTQAGKGSITTDIAPLQAYFSAEDYHQDYLVKNPKGYCGLGGTGVKYPGSPTQASAPATPQLDGKALNLQRQLVVFEAEDCAFCKQFKAEVLDHWKTDISVVRTLNPNPPNGWTLEKTLFATPTIVLFEQGKEVSRFTGFNGDKARFWQWLGFRLLTPEQQKIAFSQGTEPPSPVRTWMKNGPAPSSIRSPARRLFRSDTKFNSGTGWPSFFNPVEGSITLHEDGCHGMKRVEVRSASSGIHLGHVFDDGPAPTGKRYCINGNVLKFVPDAER